ncbi:hypothetical protein IAR55_005158 [Kwoniella newhampshirensis]|uniref:YMC020W-like alpha/beta hydrolase domain-containing protein n=1 Tax=Kwoniella newhampshirensis TaxID=1651941 RepID=A0AAW0YJ27_9TREE
MTTPNRSRKSSIVSHRAPASLRIPANPRRAASNAQLSLVFAQGDQTRSDRLCEPSLSRQLDGDLGGRQMGLRSRRSSSATVRTVRTASGLRSPSPSHASVMEEDEEQEASSRGRPMISPGAGPSSPPLSSSQAIAGRPVATPRSVSNTPSTTSLSTTPVDKRLNPKSSSTWLRWASPAPSFPRSSSAHRKGKGKERADGETVHDLSSRTTGTNPSSLTGEGDLNQCFTPENLAADAVTEAKPTIPPPPMPPNEASNAQSSQIPASAPPLTKSRGWWGGKTASQPAKTASNASSTAVPSHLISPAESTIDTTNTEAASEVATTPSLEHASVVEGSAPPSVPSPAPFTSHLNAGTAKGWKGYLGLAGDRTAPGTPEADMDKVQAQHSNDIGSPLPASNDDIGNGNVATERNLDVPASAPPVTETQEGASPPEVDAGDKPSDSQNNWTSYFYSFVVPEHKRTGPSTMPVSVTTVEPSDPVQDQKPVPSDATSAPDEGSLDSATPPPPNTTASPSPSRDTSRRPSTTGWLNYLAFRASQKKVADGSIGTAGTNRRKSAELEGEEVMDFSSDPDFPASQPSLGLVFPGAPRGQEVGAGSESSTSVTPKASQSLDIRKKRLSNASTISVTSLTPFPPSPKARSSLDNSMRAPSIKPSSSALPPPPQPFTLQSNRVLPTFATTFDRPPRSFLPLPQAKESVDSSGKGITAATTGLAWKALGAVGSYVYGETAPKPTPESILENEKEIRGRKEGRNVGAELPRRIGLGVGVPDDGWKQVRRVVVVGVHGWFPAKMLNSVIGEPTGTSVKFANMMGQAVKQFFLEKGVEDLRLTLMPLEGEGTIDSRVDRLYKAYLSNPAWINDLRRADAIFFAAHSQGCVVTTHLISRMIAQGHIRTDLNGEAKVCMLAMCGVHLGPLYSISTSTVIQPYLQWFENAAARELFEFQDTTSAVSQAYQRALSMVLENEVKVVLLASLNDQVVPIYGSSFSTATHPLLLRALYVDGASYTQSDFMTNLLCFAFMLRNAGIDDQGLVEHLSEATAGSLTGIGHSTPYEELSCYNLAVDYLFYAGSARHPMVPLKVEPFAAREAKNEYELPWILRALVDSPEVKDLFPGELKDLKEGILHWKPTTKVLKEIKKRLEPMAGRQSRLRPLTQSPSSTSLASNGDQLGASPGMNKTLTAGRVGLRRDW